MASRAEKQPTHSGKNERLLALRSLPSVEECLNAADRDRSLAQFHPSYLKILIQQSLAELRHAIAAGTNHFEENRAHLLGAVLERTHQAVASDAPPIFPVVNATGVVLHTNLGRALLAERAIEAMVEAARSPVNLEYAIVTGGRGDRDDLIEGDLCALTGAAAATVVNNNAAAVLLALHTLAAGKEVIVSRGELVEIGGAFRIPDVMTQAQVTLREVGTTNRTHPRDYLNAITSETALIMKVHPSNYQIVGFTSAVELSELVKIGREHTLDVVEDLGAGALIDLRPYGIRHEPVVAERIAAGAALVTFSGDKLLGGPQAGIVVGRRDLVNRLKANPLWRALRCDKLRLAALSATLRLYRQSRNLSQHVPTLRLLARKPGEIEQIAARARDLLVERLGVEFIIQIVKSQAEVGSGSQPAKNIESRALRITHPRRNAIAIATAFRRKKVIGRISDGGFLLDMAAITDASVLAVTPSFDT